MDLLGGLRQLRERSGDGRHVLCRAVRGRVHPHVDALPCQDAPREQRNAAPPPTAIREHAASCVAPLATGRVRCHLLACLLAELHLTHFRCRCTRRRSGFRASSAAVLAGGGLLPCRRFASTRRRRHPARTTSQHWAMLASWALLRPRSGRSQASDLARASTRKRPHGQRSREAGNI